MAERRDPPGELCPVCDGILGGCAMLEGRARPACPSPPPASPVTIDQVGCARCRGDGHPALTFHPFTYPLELGMQHGVADVVLTHWALCPTNGEPILMWIGNVEDAPGG